jgi:hypothetical protein
VTLFDRSPMSNDGSSFRDIWVFKIAGDVYCRAYTPAARADQCRFSAIPALVPWETQELLGFAVVSFETPGSLSIDQLRFVQDARALWSARPQHEPHGQAVQTSEPEESAQNNIALEDLDRADVDKDGRAEFVIVSSYTVLNEGTNSDDENIGAFSAETFSGKRLIVLREDLSLQFDAEIYQVMLPWTPGEYWTNNHQRERYSLTPSGLVVEWCEIDPVAAEDLDKCQIDRCAEPTERVSVSYDATLDAYVEVRREQLRPALADEECPQVD